ncbi:hypothetical protein [Helcococcus ovis]|uniref:hypothetical protein n=1 Tax=Helcococcus ovis TaxID=72026 RepID=UPI00106F2AAA|nr:hypothetical protein [Helcococcus ovis]TFF65468.1 hypothetical protein EQF93_08155 [Helcococcus ovis]WNZ01857.1 hypothetical protein EQF90_003200 [Helcococcus ovis]
MGIYNRILKSVVIISCIFILVSCNKESFYIFPTDKKGYPNKVILIDNKSYGLKNFGYDGLGDNIELNVKKSSKSYTKIILPKLYPTHAWKLEIENDNILKEYNQIELDIKEAERRDGYSSELQQYIINNKEINNKKIIFKWKNLEKKEEPYIVTLIFN